MDCTMCGVIVVANNSVLFRRKLLHLFLFCKEHRFVFSARKKLLRLRAAGGAMNFFPKITPPLLEICHALAIRIP